MRTIVLGAALAMVAGAAHAADLLVEAPVVSEPALATNYYLSLHGGWWLPQTADATVPTGVAPPTIGAEFTSESGFRLGAAVGLEVTPNLSIEGEISYASTSLEEATIGGTTLPVEGDVSTLSLMANAIVGADLGGWTPYVGVGAGAVNLAVSLPVQPGFGVALDDDAWTWGAQLFAGVELDVTEQLSLGARYRFQYRGDVELQDDDDRTDFLDAAGSQSVELTAKISF